MKVFPLRGKSSLIKDWQSLATDDAVQIAAWQQQFAGVLTGWGAPTGPINGFLVLDADDKPAEDDKPEKMGSEVQKKLEAELGSLPPTYTVQTGSGGSHRYYNYPSLPAGLSIRNKTNWQHEKFGFGFDVRAEGGLVATANSIHENGNPYIVINKSGVVDLPQAWIDALTTAPPQPTTSTLPTPELEEVRQAVKFLPIEQYRDRTEWRNVLMAIHSGTNGSQEGKEIARNWSLGDPSRFDEDDFQRDWKSFTPNCGITVGTLFHEAKKHGYVRLVETDPDENNLDKIIAYLHRQQNKQATCEEICQATKVPKSTFKWLRKKNPEIFRESKVGRFKYVALRTGSGMKVIDKTKVDVDNLGYTGAHLPDCLYDIINSLHRGLSPKTFMVVAAPGDTGKTEFLQNVAIENAKQGKRVCYINHEANKNMLFECFGRRAAGKPVTATQALVVLNQTPWWNNIQLMEFPGVANLPEFIEEIKQQPKGTVVCYDYMNQGFIKTDIREQTSLLAEISRQFARDLVDAGYPVFTAIQTNREGKDNIAKGTWIQPAHFVLTFKSRTFVPGAGTVNGAPNPSPNAWEIECLVEKSKGDRTISSNRVTITVDDLSRQYVSVKEKT